MLRSPSLRVEDKRASSLRNPYKCLNFGGGEPVEFAGACVDFGLEVDRGDCAFGEADPGGSVADEGRGEPFDIGAVADPAGVAVACVRCDHSRSGSISEPGSSASSSSICGLPGMCLAIISAVCRHRV